MTMTIKNDKLYTIAVITLGLGLFAGLGMVIPANADHLPNELEIYYDFDEGSGTKTIDDSGHGTNGTHAADNTSSGPEYEVGQRGTTNIAPVLGNVDALFFNATDEDFVINSTITNFPTKNFTATFWINGTDKTDEVSNGVISYGTPGTGADANAFILVLNSDLSGIPNEIRIAVNSTATNTGVVVTPNQWNHVAVTWGCSTCDGTDGTLKVFLDGSEEYEDAAFVAPPRPSSGSLVIGADQDVAGALPLPRDQYFNGTLDDIRIYNRTLTDKEIATLAMPSADLEMITDIITIGDTFGPINKQLLVPSSLWTTDTITGLEVNYTKTGICDEIALDPVLGYDLVVGTPLNFTETFNGTEPFTKHVVQNCEIEFTADDTPFVTQQIMLCADADGGEDGICPSMIDNTSAAQGGDGIVHSGDIIVEKKFLNATKFVEEGIDTPFNVTAVVFEEGSFGTECLDALEQPVLNVTAISDAELIDGGFVFFSERVTAMPGVYHCDVFFNATSDSHPEGITLGPQTVWLETIGSMGYWKNHPNATEVHLPILLGDGDNSFDVIDNATAKEVFDAHKGKFGLDKLAAQLLAAALNAWALMTGGDTSCIDDTIMDSNATLASEDDYDGPGGTKDPKFNPKQDAEFLEDLKGNHTALDNFNNFGCPLP